MAFQRELEEAKRHIEAAEQQFGDLQQLAKLNHHLLKVASARAARTAMLLELVCKKLGIDTTGTEPQVVSVDGAAPPTSSPRAG
jgi:hypothetical protein